MGRELPFGRPGEWLRCGLHMHTTNSDLRFAPNRLAEHYRRAGYDAIAITDHWVRTVERGDGGLIVIPGVELKATVDGTGSDAHVLGLGIDADPFEPGAAFPNLPDTVGWIREHGGLPYLAHPYWRGLESAEFAGCEGLAGVEVYNAGCELELGRGLSVVHWDQALERGHDLGAIATDDSHVPGFDSGFASVYALVDERTGAGVLDALERGSFYSSAGPRIEDVRVEAGPVGVSCSPAASVALVTTRTLGARVNMGPMGYRSHGTVTETGPCRRDPRGPARAPPLVADRPRRGDRHRRQARLDEPAPVRRVTGEAAGASRRAAGRKVARPSAEPRIADPRTPPMQHPPGGGEIGADGGVDRDAEQARAGEQRPGPRVSAAPRGPDRRRRPDGRRRSARARALRRLRAGAGAPRGA